jgi:DNA-binding transcriptional MerR regulator
MNINEVARKLNISVDTLKRWEKHFNLDVNRDSQGQGFYSDSDLKMFHAIKLLRDNDDSSVRENSELNENNLNTVNDTDSLNFLIQEIRGLPENRLSFILDLTEKYARVNYELGSLKAQLETKEHVLSLIADTYNKVITSLKKEIEKKNREIEEINLKKDREIEFLQAELVKERNKPWWARLIKYSK